MRKKFFDFLLISILIVVSIALKSMFAYFGWNILLSIRLFESLPEIPYLGWFAMFSFLKIIFGSGSAKSETYTISDISSRPDFLVAFIGDALNKSFALFILWIVSLVS